MTQNHDPRHAAPSADAQERAEPRPDTPGAAASGPGDRPEEAMDALAETLADADAPPPPADRLVELEAEAAELKDRLLRALADQENQRRRAERDVSEARTYAVTGFARELLDIADNFGRALATMPEEMRAEGGPLQSLADGILQTERQLLAVFERRGIAKVEPALGERFDHNRHQAMFEVDTSDHAPGTVAHVMVPGYTIGERLLRPAMVGVAKARRAPGPEGDAAA